MGDTLETLEAALPAVATVVSEINEPRIPTLMSIMKAGKKPVAELTLADLSLDAAALAPLRAVKSNLAEEQVTQTRAVRRRTGRPGRGPDQRAGRRRRPGEGEGDDRDPRLLEQLDTALELLGAPGRWPPQLDLTVSAAVLGAEAAAQAADLAGHGAAPSTCAPTRPRGPRHRRSRPGARPRRQQAGASLVLLGSTRGGRALAGRLAQPGAGCVDRRRRAGCRRRPARRRRYNLGGATVQREALTSPCRWSPSCPRSSPPTRRAARRGADAIVEVSPGLAAPAVRVVDRAQRGRAGRPGRRGAYRGRGTRPRQARRRDARRGTGRGPRRRAGLHQELRRFRLDVRRPHRRALGRQDEPRGLPGGRHPGQVQHTVGIAQARVVAVVNQDKDAPIFASPTTASSATSTRSCPR